jgi:hypothetical protein
MPRFVAMVEILAQEDPSRAETEHHQRMPIKPIAGATQPWQCAILAHGQRLNVACSALVEIAGGGVVDGVGTAPVIVGGKGEDTDGAASPVIGAAS